MRKVHTLTYNETTYNINDGGVKNDIFINGVQSGWYIEYELKKIDDDIVVPKGIRLKNHRDEDTTIFYLYLATTQLTFTDVVYIIKTINEE